MSNINLIKGFYHNIKTLFTNASMKFEIKEYSNTYIVDITPLDVYYNTAYIELEEAFRAKFEEQNPDASIVFVSEDSVLRVNESSFNFLPSRDVAEKIELSCNFNYSTNNENYSNPILGYALAA